MPEAARAQPKNDFALSPTLGQVVGFGVATGLHNKIQRNIFTITNKKVKIEKYIHF